MKRPEIKFLCDRDHTFARMTARAWSLDRITLRFYQNPHRDPLDHARFFRMLMAVTPAERKRANDAAISAVEATDFIQNILVIQASSRDDET